SPFSVASLSEEQPDETGTVGAPSVVAAPLDGQTGQETLVHRPRGRRPRRRQTPGDDRRTLRTHALKPPGGSAAAAEYLDRLRLGPSGRARQPGCGGGMPGRPPPAG